MVQRYQTQKNILILTLISLILGFMIMVAIHTNLAGQIKEEKDTQELVSYIDDLQKNIDELEISVKETREKIENIQSGQAESEQLVSSLTNQYNRLSQAVGLTELVGPGILITLDDNSVGAELAQKNNPATYNPENYIIHDKDLLYLVRSINDAAEAISINNIRLTDNSSIRCVGTVILVNGIRLAPPYEIRAIGDSTRLNELLTNSRRYKLLTYDNKPVKAFLMDNLLIPASGSAPTIIHSMPEAVPAEQE